LTILIPEVYQPNRNDNTVMPRLDRPATCARTSGLFLKKEAAGGLFVAFIETSIGEAFFFPSD
jgi:hypothetical protein